MSLPHTFTKRLAGLLLAFLLLAGCLDAPSTDTPPAPSVVEEHNETWYLHASDNQTLNIPMQTEAPIPAGALLSLNLWHDGCAALALGSGQYASSIALNTNVTGPTPVSSTEDAAPTNPIVFDDCTSWDAYPLVGGPLSPAGNLPPGWEPSQDNLGGPGVRGVDCKTLTVGPFSGPARLVWEINARLTIPTDCRGEPFSERGFLNALYLEDAGLAAYLNLTYGMPVYVSKLDSAAQNLGGILHTVSWGPVGMAPSQVRIMEDTSTAKGPSPLDLYWQKGTGIVNLRATTDSDGPLFGNRLATGEIKPPMQLASYMNGNFTGSGDWYPTFHAEGEFRIYSDLQCNHRNRRLSPSPAS
ncbi:MAG: hypothetical protein LC623_04655 [Halobacteriales archaeon]|nr:hypothetical protein [Halobacteriales archaeon]